MSTNHHISSRRHAPEIPGTHCKLSANQSDSTEYIRSQSNDQSNGTVHESTTCDLTIVQSEIHKPQPSLSIPIMQQQRQRDISSDHSIGVVHINKLSNSTLSTNKYHSTVLQSPGFNTKKFPIGINVVHSCRRLIELYGRLNEQVDYLGPILTGWNNSIQEYALYRYEQFWLPLAAEHKLYAGAPTDVLTIWLAHMMDPLVYRQDCQRLAGKLVEHRLVSRRKLRQMTEKARSLWQTRYPKEPFDFDPNRTGYNELLETRRSIHTRLSHVSGEVLHIARCHSHFFYQISLPHYLQSEFLEQAERRYKQFLYIRKLQYQISHYLQPKLSDKQINGDWMRLPGNGSELVSCNTLTSCTSQYLPIDIELVWRSHLVHPKFYARDTSCLFGRILPHSCQPYENTMLSNLDDMLSGCIVPAHMSCPIEYPSVCTTMTFDKLWHAHFPRADLHRAGSADRGNPPRGQLTELNATEIYKMSTKCAQISLTSVIGRFDPSLEKFTVQLRYHQQVEPQFSQTRLQTLVGESTVTIEQLRQISSSRDSTIHPRHSTHGLMGECICKLYSPGCIWSAMDSTRPIARFTMISGLRDQIAIDLIDKRGWLCPSNNLIGRGLVDLRTTIEQITATNPTELEFNCQLYNDTCANNSSKTINCSGISPTQSINTTTKPSVSVRLSIAPPMRHTLRLNVRVGPTFVCYLPLPSTHPRSSGYWLWGPVGTSPSRIPCNQSEFERSRSLQTSQIPVHQDDSINSTLTGLNEVRSLVTVNKVLNHMNEHVLTVRVLHNVTCQLSVVQVWSGTRLLCVGQLIGPEQLPEYRAKARCKRTKRSTLQKFRQRTQPSEAVILNSRTVQGQSCSLTDVIGEDSRSETSDSPSKQLEDTNDNNGSETSKTAFGLNWQQNERAILVKDKRGDWCLLIGRWCEFKRFPNPVWSDNRQADEVSHMLGSCTTRGHGGHLSLRIQWLSTTEPKHLFIQIPDNLNSFSIVLHDAAVNIQTGEIHISKQCEEIAQNVCLAFCCGLMHVLCQPRILTQEYGFKSLWDMGPLSYNAAGSFTSPRSQSNGSMCDVDAEQPTILTASTSFDSTNIIQLVENPLPNGNSSHDSNPTTRLNTVHKLHWSLNSTVPEEWESELKQLLRDGSSDRDSIHPTSEYLRTTTSVTVLGVASLVELPVTSVRKPSDDTQPRSNNTFGHSFLWSESNQFNSRGLLMSLQFVFCRAAGLPIDCLIPSVQMIRYTNRVKRLNAFLPADSRHEPIGRKDLTTAGTVLSKIHTNINSQIDESTKLGKSSANLAQQTGSSKYSNLFRFDDETKMKHLFLGWRLTDLYDYFLLELPDICSGCISGCQYCCGVGLL